MRLIDLMEVLQEGRYYLSIDGICDEEPCDEFLDELREEDYYKQKCIRKIKAINIITTNMEPELIIHLE